MRKYLQIFVNGYQGYVDYFIVHIISLSIGHFNHPNFSFNLGPLKYIFNNPAMHIEIPEDRKYRINFGISLSLWDYIFGTAVISHNGRDIKLGFPGLGKFPKKFIPQALNGFNKETS